MLFTPIVTKIGEVLKANTPNGMIAAYRDYVIEPGVHAVPACVIGSTRSLSLDEDYLSDTPNAHSRLWKFKIGIAVLSRKYRLPEDVKTAMELLDTCQAAVYMALNANTNLDEIVEQAWVEEVREIKMYQGEYFGYEIQFVGLKYESHVV